MTIKILSFKFSGVKSIQKEIGFKFSNYSLKDPSKNIAKIKSIYGVNGAGKTSIVLGMRILIGLLRNPDYLSEKRVILNDLINFNTNTFSAIVLFALFNDENKLLNIFRYEISFTKSDNTYIIDYEKMDYFTSNNLKGATKNIFDIKKGQIQSICSSIDGYQEALANQYNNLLLKSSLLSCHPKLETEKNDIDVIKYQKKYFFSYAVISLFIFANSVLTFTDRDNIPLNPNLHLERIKNYIKKESDHPGIVSNVNENKILVAKSDYAAFEKMSKQLEKFIKLFKPELKEIKLDKTEDGEDTYAVRRSFYYGGKNLVNEYLESTGIKRINQLFQFLDFAINGGIVFIDELDASISGIYLLKLLQYIEKFGKGQLCYTCHNTYLMKAVQNQKHSIDFISTNGIIKSWAKNSHYLPEDQFTKGYIPGFAFNAIDLDFYDVFPVEER